MDGLPPFQARFVDEYMICRVQREAIIRSGSKSKNPSQLAQNYMNLPAVKAEIERRERLTAEKAAVTLEMVVAEMALIAFANKDDFVSYDERGHAYVDFSRIAKLPEEERRKKMAALSSLTTEEYVEGRGENMRDVKRVRFTMWDKTSALHKLGQHLGGFKTISELTGPAGGPLVVKVTPTDDAL